MINWTKETIAEFMKEFEAELSRRMDSLIERLFGEEK